MEKSNERFYSVDQFVSLEQRVWTALKTGDSAIDGEMLTDDFLGVYSDGFAGKSEHVNQLRHGPTIHDYKIVEPRIITLAEDVVLLSYRAIFSRISSANTGPVESMLVSSIWREFPGGWRNIFSQDTAND